MGHRKQSVGYELVAAAAVNMLIEGERPTVRGVRERIGYGSPNVILRFLTLWFKSLGSHLATHSFICEAIEEKPSARSRVPTCVWELGTLAVAEAEQARPMTSASTSCALSA